MDVDLGKRGDVRRESGRRGHCSQNVIYERKNQNNEVFHVSFMKKEKEEHGGGGEQENDDDD